MPVRAIGRVALIKGELMAKQLVMLFVAMLAMTVSAADQIAFVNVENAIDHSLLQRVVSNDVGSVIMINAVVDKSKMVNLDTLAGMASRGYPKDSRKISIYFIDTTSLPPQITCPGFFAVINVRGLKKDADANTYENRIAKMALKGLAFACGFGANQDIGRCVMAMGSFDTLKGIDSTSTSYSPFCFFPLTDYLQSRNLINAPTE